MHDAPNPVFLRLLQLQLQFQFQFQFHEQLLLLLLRQLFHSQRWMSLLPPQVSQQDMAEQSQDAESWFSSIPAPPPKSDCAIETWDLRLFEKRFEIYLNYFEKRFEIYLNYLLFYQKKNPSTSIPYFIIKLRKNKHKR